MKTKSSASCGNILYEYEKLENENRDMKGEIVRLQRQINSLTKENENLKKKIKNLNNKG